MYCGVSTLGNFALRVRLPIMACFFLIMFVSGWDWGWTIGMSINRGHSWHWEGGRCLQYGSEVGRERGS